MILTRPGNKKELVGPLHGYFPPHRCRILPFFGAGGDFFKMPKADFTVINDGDDDVTNLFLTVINQREELRKLIEIMPISQSLLKYWLKNKEADPVKKSVRFLLLSNFTYMGKQDTIKFGVNRTKENLLRRIEPTFKELVGTTTQIMTEDFRDVIKKISFADRVLSRDESFIYMDPAYLDTTNTYSTPDWTKEDAVDCLGIMVNEGIKAAMSEFDHPFIMSEAKKRGLNIFPLKSRRNMKNRRTEILITNYLPNHRLF